MIDLSGQKFGMLTVLGRSERTQKNHSVWRCLCDCGRTSDALSNNLRRGLTSSCGCQVRAVNKVRMTIHGETTEHTRSREFNSWRAMFDRCENPKTRSYKDYGGRGIQICARWRESFDNFLSDMGRRPPRTSIDRIDVNGNYEPSNCRWADAKQQRANQRKTESPRMAS